MRTRSREVATAVGPWLPLAFAAAYAVLLLADLRSLVQSIYQQADFASGVYIGELYPEAPDGTRVVLTNFAWYATLWFEQLTHWLPAHRQIWQVGPWAASLLGVALVGWATARAAGRWAGTMVAVVLACGGPGLLSWQIPGTGHAPAFAHTCLLAAFLVALAGCADGRIGGRAWHLAACAGVAAITAAGVASDSLLLAAGVAPFVLAGLVLGRRLGPPAGRRVAVAALLVGAGATAGGFAIRAVMESQHVVARHFEIELAAFDRLAPNFWVLLQSLAYSFNGDFGGLRVDAVGVLTVACAAVVAAACWVVVRLGREWWGQTAASATVAPGGRDASRLAHVTFWLLAVVVVLVAFVLTSVPIDRYSNRYVVTASYGLAALVAVVAAVGGAAARVVVALGVCVIVGASARVLAAEEIQTSLSRYPGGSQSGPLLRLARAEGVRYGYAGYWDAAPLSWQMKTEVQLYPVEPCEGPASGLCPSEIHRIDSWYTPRPGVRTMLVVDPVFPERGPVDAPRALGPPDRTVVVNRLTVHVYPYDIAERLGPPVGL